MLTHFNKLPLVAHLDFFPSISLSQTEKGRINCWEKKRKGKEKIPENLGKDGQKEKVRKKASPKKSLKAPPP